jgi:hypothetical protein
MVISDDEIRNMSRYDHTLGESVRGLLDRIVDLQNRVEALEARAGTAD